MSKPIEVIQPYTRYVKPLSHKRQIEILKSYEEFEARRKTAKWQHEPTLDCFFRLAALIQFDPNKSTRQIFNHAEYISNKKGEKP